MLFNVRVDGMIYAVTIRPRVGIKSSKIWRRIFEPYLRRSLKALAWEHIEICA